MQPEKRRGGAPRIHRLSIEGYAAVAKPGALSEAILSRQRRWAELRRIDVSDAGHALAPDSNLLQPLSPESRSELEGAPRRPLGDGQKPGDLQLLHSTDALVCNVFDYWRERELAPLSEACGADSRVHRLRYAQHDDSSGGEDMRAAHGDGSSGSDAINPPDMLLHGEDARATAIVASFTEPYASRHPAGCEDTRGLSFMLGSQATGRLLEGEALPGSLPGCYNLASDLHANRDRFRTLPVVRLLDLCNELTRRHGHRGFRLLYLWFDGEGHCAGRHLGEIDRFRMRIGGEVDFAAQSWQELFQRLHHAGADHRRYLDYLQARYFSL
jgi:hypothetical protein